VKVLLAVSYKEDRECFQYTVVADPNPGTLFTSPFSPRPNRMAATDLWIRVITVDDSSALDALFYRPPHRFWGRSHDYIRWAFSLAHEAEDLASEAVFKAFRARLKFDMKGRFEPWFWKIVNNTTLDYLKSAARKYEVQLDESVPDERARAEHLRQEDALLLDKILAVPILSQIDQQVLILSCEGLTNEELAATLQIPVHRIYQLRSEAIKKLRECLFTGGPL
jgi:RNA polymerase sigma factor (sigma-70 family)